MRTMMYLLLAALPPAATWAQHGTPAAPNSNAQAGQGARFCGHALDAGTFVDARAHNASGDEALVIRWLDPKGTAVHTALFMGRCVAKDGDTIDGRVIVRVLPNSLAVSEPHGLTAWEAEYRYDYGVLGLGQSRRGAFSDDHFVAELDPSNASEAGSASGDPDFRWNAQDETLAMKPGVRVSDVLIYTYPAAPNKPANAQYTPSQAPQPSAAQPPNVASAPAQPAPAAKPNCKPQQGPKVTGVVPKKPSAWACQHLGICTDNKPVVLNGGDVCPPAPAGGQPVKQ